MTLYIRVGHLTGDINNHTQVWEARLCKLESAIPDKTEFGGGERQDWHWSWQEAVLSPNLLKVSTKIVYAVNNSAYDWPEFRRAFLKRKDALEHVRKGLISGEFVYWDGFKMVPQRRARMYWMWPRICKIKLADVEEFLTKPELTGGEEIHEKDVEL
jgi:hypothetical protein